MDKKMTSMDVNNGYMYPKKSYRFLRIPPKDDATPSNQPPDMKKYIISIIEDKSMKFFKNALIRTVKGYEIGAELLLMTNILSIAKTHNPHQTEMIRTIIQIMIQQLQKEWGIPDEEIGEFMLMLTLSELNRQHDEKIELKEYSKQNIQESNITSEQADVCGILNEGTL